METPKGIIERIEAIAEREWVHQDTEIIGYHDDASRFFVTIAGKFPKARDFIERLERAYAAFRGDAYFIWGLEKNVVAKIVARYNVGQARKSDEPAAEVLSMDTPTLNAEIQSSP